MTLYLWVKYLHILSSTILFGTGIGTACVMYYGHKNTSPGTMAVIYRYVITADWMFTGSSGLLQLLTGFYLIHLGGYTFTAFWIWASILGYFIAMSCWFPIIYLRMRLRDFAESAYERNAPLSERYHPYFTVCMILTCIAFTSLLWVFYLMTFKPNWLA